MTPSQFHVIEAVDGLQPCNIGLVTITDIISDVVLIHGRCTSCIGDQSFVAPLEAHLDTVDFRVHFCLVIRNVVADFEHL